jgi:hypothetical protein
MGGAAVTRQRIYGDDNVWGAWVRHLGRHGGPLPSSSPQRGTTINDWDMIVHQYKTPVDQLGTREVHCLMFVECKTRLANVSSTQQETLWFNHQYTFRKSQACLVGGRQKVSVWHFGVSVLRCEGDDPMCARRFEWGRFDEHGYLRYRAVDASLVTQLLSFDVDADTLRRASFRRHHKNEPYVKHVLTPMGLLVEEYGVRRS